MNVTKFDPGEILNFWFVEITPKQWWDKSEDFDELIRSRFGSVHKAALACECYDWRKNAEGRLAEIIVLDQFSRNIYRNHANAFASDALALALAQTAVIAGADRDLVLDRRTFLYMPYMHSESSVIHQIALTLFNAPGMENNYDFELRHKKIIDRFGRYPHRNSILGRDSTPEEIEFLKTAGSAF
jgi:uncharacterized protein (DUF924 family)